MSEVSHLLTLGHLARLWHLLTSFSIAAANIYKPSLPCSSSCFSYRLISSSPARHLPDSSILSLLNAMPSAGLRSLMSSTEPSRYKI